MHNYSTSAFPSQNTGFGAALPGREEASAEPPSDNMGVKNPTDQNTANAEPKVSFHVDYLRITAWIDQPYWEDVYDRTLGFALGKWVQCQRAGRFYQKMSEAHLGARLYEQPSVETLDPRQITIELPGKACSYLGWMALQRFYIQLAIHSDRISVTRIDLAFDDAPFSVTDFWGAIFEGECRTYARRETFRIIQNPFESRENGSGGCSTVYVGRRESLRMLRVYDKHGSTRVELEVHNKKAQQIAGDIFDTGGEGREMMNKVYARSMGHLRDFIDVDRDFWEAFTSGIVRAFAALTGQAAQEIDSEKIVTWLCKQVSSAFSVALDVYGESIVQTLLAQGRMNRRKNHKYQVILGDEV